MKEGELNRAQRLNEAKRLNDLNGFNLKELHERRIIWQHVPEERFRESAEP